MNFNEQVEQEVIKDKSNSKTSKVCTPLEL